MALAKLFDPSSVTMTSTNIPDALVKLETVLADTSKASLTLLQLLDQHDELLRRGDGHLLELERLAARGECSSLQIESFLVDYRELNRTLQRVSSDIVMSQEYQDLCGQKVKKVISLLEVIATELTELLAHQKVKYDQQASVGGTDDPALDQDAADKVLKDLGF
jgi:chemotaxis protein CheZ